MLRLESQTTVFSTLVMSWVFPSRDFSTQSLASSSLSTVLPAMLCVGNKHLSLVAVDAELSLSRRGAILDRLNAAHELNAEIFTLWNESPNIFVRVGKSEATEVQFAKRCDQNKMDELILELTTTVNAAFGAEAVGNWIYEALYYQRYHMTLY